MNQTELPLVLHIKEQRRQIKQFQLLGILLCPLPKQRSQVLPYYSVISSFRTGNLLCPVFTDISLVPSANPSHSRYSINIAEQQNVMPRRKAGCRLLWSVDSYDSDQLQWFTRHLRWVGNVKWKRVNFERQKTSYCNTTFDPFPALTLIQLERVIFGVRTISFLLAAQHELLQGLL